MHAFMSILEPKSPELDHQHLIQGLSKIEGQSSGTNICLVQWLKYSRKEYCELCHHQFNFMPIYSPDMPKRLPLRDIFSGLLTTIAKVVRNWLHYTLVAFAWLGVVPLTACRMYRCLFTGSVTSFLTFPLDILSGDNLVSDCLHGCVIVTCTLCAFISLVWLREQIMHGGGPEWLEQDVPAQNHAGNANEPPGDAPQNDDDSDNEVEGNAEEEPNPPNDNDAAEGAQDEANWNPIEWDRAAEELTWERLLGLDGSLAFLTASAQFEGLATTFCGYIAFGIAFVILQAIASILKFKKAKRFLGICYIIIKVALLTIFEIGIFPLICGFWLDICSLPLLQATVQNRRDSFVAAPGTSLFLHWLIGMVFVFYFSSFIVLLREVLRPGMLWFLRNVNDPDFNPIQEVSDGAYDSSTDIFPSSTICYFYFNVWNNYFTSAETPIMDYFNIDTPVSELSLELLLLQVTIPALLEQGHIRAWLRNVIRGWCIGVSYFLSLRSYLLGDVPLSEQSGENENPADGNAAAANNNNDGDIRANNHRMPGDVFGHGGLRAAHHALLHGPVLIIGRFMMCLWMGDRDVKVHELYTAACGLYICWLCTRIVTILLCWVPEGWNVIYEKVKFWALIGFKCFVVISLLFGLVPLLVGLLFELVVFVPLRVSYNQSPLYFLWQDWVLGILYAKIICAVTMMGPKWWLKDALDQMYQNGLRQINLSFVIRKLIIPVVICLGLALSIPYVIASSLVPLFGVSFSVRNQISRRIYPSLASLILLYCVLDFQIRQFSKLYEHIKNDKYLVGRRLVNYEHKKKQSQASFDSK
ncbi:E3 ubiquitin-protein ligase MARCH6 [Nymphon striatum]|nr:E3 ubiquitin-protein ligase MARCH6 [Nymphon striatum]